MDNRLKNCPFCGGRAEEVITGKGTANPEHRIRCTVCGCQTPATVASPLHVETWNKREERTCKFVTSRGSDYPPACSACGYELGIYDCEWSGDGTYSYGANFCPNCGAKVVEQ